MDIRNLGVFATMSAVWAAYPSGGREGDYLFIGVDEETGTKYRWNIYALLWENADTVTESDGRQSVDFSDLNVQNDVNIAGNEKLQGDIEVQGKASVLSHFHAGSISSDGNAQITGNMKIGGNLDVEGSARALNVEWPYVGRFVTSEALNAAYPSPKVGWWAHVGTGDELIIYRCDTEGTWSETTEESTPVGPAVITTEEMASVLT